MKINPTITFDFSSVSDGNMSFKWGDAAHVIENRKNFLKKMGVELESCIVPQLEHGEVITIVSNEDKGKGTFDGESGIATEALITSESEITLFMVTADCFPVGFYDEEKHIIALAHLGWKPIDKKLAYKTVMKLKEHYHSRPENINVFIGPGIRKGSYVFPAQLTQQKDFPHWKKYMTQTENDIHVDLVAFIKDQLKEAGVIETNINDCMIDTWSNENYYSHRRSQATGEPEGRFATILRLNRQSN